MDGVVTSDAAPPEPGVYSSDVGEPESTDHPQSGGETPVKKTVERHDGDDESGEDTARPSRKQNGMYSDEDDESEESEEEETEADRHFIVDDAEDDEEEGAEEEEAPHHKRRRKKRRRAHVDSESELDEDDLDLVHENTGGSKKFKRLKRKVDDDEVAKIFSDEDEAPIRVDNQRDLYDEDDMEDFIIDDEEGEGAEVDRAEKLAQRRKEKAIMGQNLGRNLGISDEQWRDAQDLFDFEIDYGWAMHEKGDAMDLDENDEEAPVPKEKTIKLTDVFEPSEIAEKMLTDADEIIRVNDIPERLQLRGDMPVPEPGELAREAVYIARQIFEKKKINEEPKPDHPIVESIAKVLEFLRGENEKQERPHFEVPFILTHRKDYIEGLLDRNDLWRVYDLDYQFISFEQKKKSIFQLYRDISKMSTQASQETYVEEMLAKADSVEDIMDVSQYIQLRYGNELAQAEQSRRPMFKRARRQTPYDIARNAGIGEMVKFFSCDPREIGSDITAGSLKSEAPETTPLETAARFVAGPFSTPESVLEAARLMLATEMACDPTFRAFVRGVYSSDAWVTITPTNKGRSEIDYHHEFYPFKYLTGKYSYEFTDGQFLEVIKAEQLGLVELEIKISAEDEFFNDVVRRSSFNTHSAGAKEWNDEIRKVLKHACHEILFPQIGKWHKERLAAAASDYVALQCQISLETKINHAGFVKKDDKDHVDDWEPRVLAISWGDGDSNASTWSVVLSEAGEVLQTAKLDRFRGPPEQRGPDIEVLTNMISNHNPDVVAIAGFKPNTKTILHRALQEVLEEAFAAGRTKEDLKIFFVDDEVARIYMNSARGIREFPDKSYPPLVRYLVSLGRRVQDPVMEFAGLMDKDIQNLKLHHLQREISEEKYKWACQKAFINIVNSVGVDINLAAQHPHKSATLQFVAGLGPRKAQAFLSKLSRGSQRFEARAQLIRKSMCGKRVFMNCASFIRVRARNFAQFEANLDVLDDTRIHPEDYDLARKMAADALDYEDAAIDDEDNPSLHVAELMDSEADLVKLAHLALDEFAMELERRMKERKKMVLQDIMKEIMHPFGETRKPFEGANADQIFTMLTGEDDRTLSESSVVSAQIVRVNDRFLKCRLNSGLDGLVHIRQVPPDRHGNPPTSLLDLFREDTLIQAKVLRVEKEKLTVDLSLRDVNSDIMRNLVTVDRKFDRRREDEEIVAQRNIDVRKSKAKQVRQIKHPYFKIMDFRAAVAYLADKAPGTVVIRPSTKGHDHFSITWKVDDGVFQHVDVVESKKENDMALGQVLSIEGERYSEIDQIIAEYIEPTYRRVQDTFNHTKYQRRTLPDMTRYIEEQCAATRRSAYGLIQCREKPCHFYLVYKHPQTRPHQEYVIVKHKGYVFRKRMFGSVDEVLRYFKEDEARRASQGGSRGASGGSGGRQQQATRGGVAPAPPPGVYGRAPAPGQYMGRA
ncbi:hypothetical protein PhCBS80983_g02513 [Powellomyces hirtus]|uniref:Transcription elongation factor Spt6 n=1 Tax=Powellomyces hirtus TaxID=109895 RepID=A0A507E5I4_9FUNG|nr:hypothetical protein PhCBS80983_g02513 [Powellomyces hirtus]